MRKRLQFVLPGRRLQFCLTGALVKILSLYWIAYEPELTSITSVPNIYKYTVVNPELIFDLDTAKGKNQ